MISEASDGEVLLTPGASASVERMPALSDLETSATFATWAVAQLMALVGQLAPGAECRAQTLNFDERPSPGASVALTVSVVDSRGPVNLATLSCAAIDRQGHRVLVGMLTLRRSPARFPRAVAGGQQADATAAHLCPHGTYEALMTRCVGREPLPTAIVYPIDSPALAAAVEAADARLITPILIGPASAICAAASSAGLDISAWPIVDVATDIAAASAGVQLVREGRARLLMKGSLHTATLVHAVLSHDAGLSRSSRISHVFVFDIPAYSKPLLVTDAVVAIAPTLDDKAAICRNAIQVAHVLGIPRPKVAILSAIEDVDPAIPSTLDAAALCKMADRGQITGAILDGPLAMDNAISMASAATKGIVSAVAGDADILVVPNLEAGNILYKNLVYFAGADAAGVIVGASVPIILVSRADSVRTRLASTALASILATADDASPAAR